MLDGWMLDSGLWGASRNEVGFSWIWLDLVAWGFQNEVQFGPVWSGLVGGKRRKSESGSESESGRGPLAGGVDPLHRYKPHKHWVGLRSNPLQNPLQSVTQPVTLAGLMRRGLMDDGWWDDGPKK